MADEAKKPFRQYFYRGVEAEKLLFVPEDELIQMLHARARRRLTRGSKFGYNKAFQHLRDRIKKARARVTDPLDKPQVVKTHLRNAIILPEMIAAELGVYNGLGYHKVEVKPNMVGHYLGEFSLTYTPVRHGGKTGPATSISKFLPTN